MLDWLTKPPTPAGRARIEPKIGNLTEYHDVPSSDRVKMGQIFGEFPTSAGAVVNERSAMTSAAAFSCVRLIGGAIASLPLPVYERSEDGRKRADHDYWWLLNEQPTARFTAAAFWEFVVNQQLLRGDAIAYIERGRRGEAVGFIPWPRSKVEIRRLGDRLRGIENRSDRVAVPGRVARSGEQRREVEHLVEHEVDIAAVDDR